MSKCNNVNAPEFVALKKAFKSQFKANSIVNKWQAITSLDRLPTIDEAKQLVSNEEALFTADKLELGNAILNNLVRLNFIEKVRGGFVVKNSTIKDYNRNLIENNVDRIWNYLAINNINSDAIEYTKNPGKGVYINVNVDNLKKRDIIAARNSLFKGVEQQQNNTRTRHVVAHLKRIFPDVKVEFMSVKEAYDYYMNKPKEQRKSKFENVKSFYDPKTGTAILIKERLTDDIAIEEILHPFINSLELDNKALYGNLLVEAKTNFPKLKEEIEEGYSDSKGFTQEYRDKELVTQSLARHFRFEFENKPTNTFKELVKQFLDWFKKIINNIHKYITGTEIGQPTVQEETLAATSEGTLFTEDIMQNRLNIDSKYKGKIIFASSGIGKSFAKELNGRIIDSDQVYASILGVSVAELLDKLISLTWNEKKLVLKKLRTTLKSLAEEGFTVLTPTESLIDIADFAFIQGNPEQMAANTRNENRENPYEQTIVEAKERINRYKQRLKKADLELVILDENDYLSNYIFVEKNPIERISRDANTLLNKKLVTYLANFGISVRELKNIQEQLNIDALGFVDMLNKVAYVDESDSKELPYLAGKFIAHMMQYNPLLTDIYAELRNAVQSADKNELLDQIGIMIGDRLLGITSTPERLALSIRIIKLIDKLLAYFLEMIGKINYTQINKNVGIIVEGILADNKNMITASRYKPGFEGQPVKKVFFQSALKKDKFASIIVNQFAKAGFILTGSVTLSEQGSIYRPVENQVHDLDWVSPYNRKVTREKFKELYPEAIFIRDILNDVYVTDTYVIAPEGYKIENIEIVGERKTVLAYDVVSKKTNEVKGTYRLVDKKEVMTGVEGKLIDFFSYPLKTDETDTSMFVMLPSGQKLAIAEFQKTFRAKLSFQRLKDIWDYNRYIPFEEFRQLINNAKEYSTLGKTKVKELESITPKVNIINYRTMDDKSKKDAINGKKEAQKRWVEEEIAEFYEAIEQYNKGLNTFSSKGVNKGKATINDVIDETLGIFRTIQMFPDFSNIILPYLEDIKIALNTFDRKEGYAIYKEKKNKKGQAKEMTFENLFEVVDKFITPVQEAKAPVEITQKISRVKDLFKMIELIEELQKIKKGDTIDIFYDENDFSEMFPSGISAASELSDIANEYDINVEEYKYEEDAYGYTGLDINLETIKFDFIESLMGFKSDLVNEIKTSLSDLLQNEDIDIDMLYNMMFFEVGETTSNKLDEYHFLKGGDFSIKSIEDGNFQVAKSIVEGIMESYSETADVVEEAPTEVTPEESQEIVYTAAFVDSSLTDRYSSDLPNKYGHHMTVSFRPDTLDVRVGEKVKLKIIGRLTTDKVDVLIVENFESHNEFPHITLSTAEGVKAFASNAEIKNNQDKIVPLNETIDATYGYFDGSNDVVTPTGKQKNIALSDISPEATLSDIAKLLNTKDVVFDINHQIEGDIQFSLSPERNKLINNIKSGPLGNKPNALQLQMLDLFTHASKQASKEVDGFVATSYLENQGVIVELNEADHTYKDNFGQPYMGTTTAIGGSMKNKEDVALNLAVGNDFDSIVEGIILKKSFDEIFKGVTKLNREQADRAYTLLHGNLKLILKGGAMAIPQVVVFDVEAKIAGMIDILVVMPNGKLKIIDLKTAKHSVNRVFRGEISYESSEWDLEDDSLLKQLGLTDVLSTKAKQSIQIGVYQRMLENMGYEISKADDALSTFHIQVGITGKGKDQVFDGTFKVDEWLNHNPMENLPYVDALVPLSPLLQLDIAELEEIAAEQKITEEELLGQELMLTDGELINEVEEFNVIAEGLKNYKGALIKRREAIEKIRSSVYMDRSKEETVEYIQKTISMISIVLSSRNVTEAKVLFSNLVRDSIKQVDSFKEYLENPINVNDTNYITYALNIERFAVTYQGLHAVKGAIGLAKRQTDLLFILQSKLNELVGTHSDERSTVDQAILDFVMNIIAKNTLEDNISKEDLWKIVTEAKDISGSEWMTRDMATSTDRILAIMNKIYHNDKMKVIDNVQKRAFTITSVAEKLLKLSVSSNPQEIYDFMLNLDENNEWDGKYLREIGSAYYNLFDKYKDATYDEGSPMNYINIKDPSTATAKEVQFNIDLANKKDEFSKFMEAESYDNEGGYSDGMYHRWNKEFKDARKKHERWVSYGRYGEWLKKANVTRRAWGAYRAKYYRENTYIAVKRVKNGRPTGITFETTNEFVKTEYREIRKTARNGDSMLSDRYKKLISPTDALGRAQLEFYNMFRDMFEKKLLTKLPMGIRGQMLGRAPVVPGKLFTSLKKKPNFVVGLWARMTRSVENLITDTTEQRAVVTDERGNPVDGIPILFTGRPRDEAKMKKIQEEITVLKNQYKNFEIKADAYKKQIKILNGKYLAIRSKPSTNEISRDLGTSLLKFSHMAEHYEVMTAAEDTFNSMIKVLENRDYQPSGQQELGKKIKGVFRKKGVKTKGDANVVKRAKNFMHMVYYDDEHLTKGKVDKVVDGLIKYTSLSYVAFNPFGSFNNYVYGKISNNIEALGQRHFKLKSYYRAEYEFTKRAIPSLIHRMSSAGEKLSAKSFYDPKLPGVLYDALVDEFRMMDDKGDLRESGNTDESYFQRLYNFGYYMQDAAEYNVQTKVGMAILMDTMIKNSKTGDISTLYDAYGFDSIGKKATLKEGYDTIVTMDRNDPTKVLSERAFDATFRYNLRSKIREVNKQIHGNYARDDRMVMQTFAVGKLAAQFHKWVAPALRARFQAEYFDENLGWMEGRYIALGKYLAFVGKHIMKGDLEFGTYNEKFVEHYRDERGTSEQHYQKGTDKLMSFKKTTGELMIIALTMLLGDALAAMWGSDGDDDELSKVKSTGDVVFLEDMSEHIKRFRNYLRYQADRSVKDMVLFIPIPGAGGFQQMYQMFKSPIASTRTLGELGEAISLSVRTPLGYLWYDEETFWSEKAYVYQRGARKGELKLNKNWADAVPIWYAMKKWVDYSTLTNFFIK